MNSIFPPLSTLDMYLVGYLICQGFSPDYKVQSGRCVFYFEGSAQLYDHINNFNSNSQIAVGTYTTVLRKLRAKMYSATREGVLR